MARRSVLRALVPELKLDPFSLQLRYANNSNYKNDTIIRKEVFVTQPVLDELNRIVLDSEVRMRRRLCVLGDCCAIPCVKPVSFACHMHGSGSVHCHWIRVGRSSDAVSTWLPCCGLPL